MKPLDIKKLERALQIAREHLPADDADRRQRWRTLSASSAR